MRTEKANVQYKMLLCYARKKKRKKKFICVVVIKSLIQHQLDFLENIAETN